MFLIILFLVVFSHRFALSYSHPSHSQIRNKIKTIVYSHAYIKDVNDMCGLVVSRIRNAGMFIKSTSLCTQAPVKSKYGNTLEQIYQHFEDFTHDDISLKINNVDNTYKECKFQCQLSTVIGEQHQTWVDKQAPPINIDTCFKDKLPCVQFDNCFKDKLPCVPFQNIILGNFTLDFSHCKKIIDDYHAQIFEFHNYRLYVQTRTAKLSQEISEIWYQQMPSVLATVVST